MTPDYERGGVRLYCARCEDVLPTLSRDDFAGVIVDPPYGVAWSSGWTDDASRILNDSDTAVRDYILAWAAPKPVACFSSWRLPPAGAKGRVVWDKGSGVGMGDLSFPWFASAEDVYLLGEGWEGRRRDSVLRFQKAVGGALLHPHEKPVPLLARIIETMPPGAILDPCMGSASVGMAAIGMKRAYVGIEADPARFDVAVRRIDAELAQGQLFAAGGA